MIACVSKPFQHMYLLETMSNRPSPSTSTSLVAKQRPRGARRERHASRVPRPAVISVRDFGASDRASFVEERGD